MSAFLQFQPRTDDIDLGRIERLRKKMAERQASLCAQRALLYTESFRQTEGEPYIVRKAKAFAHTLANMTIYVEDDALIFGNQASRNFAAPVFPEFSVDWVIAAFGRHLDVGGRPYRARPSDAAGTRIPVLDRGSRREKKPDGFDEGTAGVL